MNEQYYPTPEALGRKLANMIAQPQPPILEPSAGTGKLIEAMRHRDGRWKPDEKDFHCVEVNAERAASLKGKGYIVVGKDFLEFKPLVKYQTAIMNPPFHEGAKHLNHALNVLADGGEVACILNAETIRNPYSNERKILIQQLEECETYSVEYVQEAFESTDVEIAIVYAKKKAAQVRCETFETYKRLIIEEREQGELQGLIRGNAIEGMIDVYRAAVESALKIFDELSAFNQQFKGEDVFHEILELKNRHESRRDIAKKINGYFWNRLLYSKEFERLLTNDVRQVYASKLRAMAEYEFNEENILQLKMDLVKNLTANIDAAIMKVWENFTSRFSYRDEKSPNIHYYNGWKTNEAFKCNRKVIIPLYAFSSWTQKLELYRVRDNLADIEKAMNYLDCGRTEDSDMANKLEVAQARGMTRNIDTKYFTVTVYKKGTAHLTFKDEELLKKFNLYCGRKKKWLPEDYGYKPYEALNAQEREVADSFEGAESYRETYANRQYFLTTSNPLLRS